MALYADDSKIFRSINTLTDQWSFQQDLDSLHEWWSEVSEMEFNIKKCKLMRIIKKKQPLSGNLSMNCTTLDEVDEFKDLGILTDCQLSWNQHVDSVKANRILGLISRSFSGLHDQAMLKTLYCSLVCPHLEYCSVVWSPHTQRNINWQHVREGPTQSNQNDTEIQKL